MVSFKISYFQKSLLKYFIFKSLSQKFIGYFGLFTKIKKGYGTSCKYRFSAYLFHKNIPY